MKIEEKEIYSDEIMQMSAFCRQASDPAQLPKMMKVLQGLEHRDFIKSMLSRIRFKDSTLLEYMEKYAEE